MVSQLECYLKSKEGGVCCAISIQDTVAASLPFGGTEIDHPRNTLPGLAVKCLEGTKSWAHFQI
jgi:hypothetical protein